VNTCSAKINIHQQSISPLRLQLTPVIKLIPSEYNSPLPLQTPSTNFNSPSKINPDAIMQLLMMFLSVFGISTSLVTLACQTLESKASGSARANVVFRSAPLLLPLSLLVALPPILLLTFRTLSRSHCLLAITAVMHFSLIIPASSYGKSVTAWLLLTLHRRFMLSCRLSTLMSSLRLLPAQTIWT
jgi:hypothetical protein